MDGLYPYVHRRRKSLILEDTLPVPAKVEPAKAPADGQQTQQADKLKLSDGENASQPEGE